MEIVSKDVTEISDWPKSLRTMAAVCGPDDRVTLRLTSEQARLFARCIDLDERGAAARASMRELADLLARQAELSVKVKRLMRRTWIAVCIELALLAAILASVVWGAA